MHDRATGLLHRSEQGRRGRETYDEEVEDIRENVKTPLGNRGGVEGGEKSGSDHGDVGNDEQDDVDGGDTGEEGEIKEEERGGNHPVDV